LAAISVRLQQLGSPFSNVLAAFLLWFFSQVFSSLILFCEVLLWDSFVRFLVLQFLPAIFVRFSCQVLSSIFWLHIWFHSFVLLHSVMHSLWDSFVRLSLLQSLADMHERKERQWPPCHGVCPHCTVISNREKSETAERNLQNSYNHHA
jgi:hypothetical protein